MLRRALAALLSLALLVPLLALSACDSGSPREDPQAPPASLTYRITGGEAPNVTYFDADGSTQSTTEANVPFEVEIGGFELGDQAFIGAGLNSRGSVTVQILDEEGDVLDESTGAGLGATVQAWYEFD